MDASFLQPIEAAVTLSVIWIGLGVIGLAFLRAPRLITHFVFPAGALVSLLLSAIRTLATTALGGPRRAHAIIASTESQRSIFWVPENCVTGGNALEFTLSVALVAVAGLSGASPQQTDNRCFPPRRPMPRSSSAACCSG